ncbi:hypothetical protein JCM10207_001899 [Rhodosporidiobolus poonsookiae]
MLLLRKGGAVARTGARAPSSCRAFTAAAIRRSTIPPVVGTGGDSQRQLLLHTPHPYSEWPSHLNSVSPLYAELGRRPQLGKLAFNFTDAGSGPVEQEWDPKRPKFEKPPETGEEEVYSATLYPDFVHIPALSISSLPAFESLYASLPPIPSSGAALSSDTTSASPPRVHIFVCTHGTRDCRCSDLGEPLYQALVKEVQRRKTGGELKGNLEEGGVRISRVAHVGGHKWAGNAMVYREGSGCDLYGLLRASDAVELLDYATSPSPAPWYSRWRGRLGLSSEQVKDAYFEQANSGKKARGRKEERRNELGDPVELRFVTFEGEEIVVKGYEGESLMETARRHDLPSILATCGGHCECATCHVHLPPLLPAAPSSALTDSAPPARKPAAVPVFPPAPEMTDEEDEQLEFAIGADDDSRLACQIPVTKELGEWVAQGGRIKLPRY